MDLNLLSFVSDHLGTKKRERVCERERERVCVCVRQRERVRERERERESEREREIVRETVARRKRQKT